MWIVTWESKESGKWISAPVGPFLTKKSAIKYMNDVRDIVLPNHMELYRCQLAMEE